MMSLIIPLKNQFTLMAVEDSCAIPIPKLATAQRNFQKALGRGKTKWHH
jgi:hypothetical protein